MTAAQQAEYLTANGWQRKGEYWFCRGVGYAWELSAAVDQQKYLDRIAEEDGKSGKDAGTPQGKRVARG